MIIEPFQREVNALLERLSNDNDSVPLDDLERGAKILATIAAQHNAGSLERLSQRLAEFASIASQNEFPVSVTELEPAFKALERAADPAQDLEILENELERLEEDAILYAPPIGALQLEPAPIIEPQSEDAPSGFRRVLSVDDSGLVRSALRRIFAEAGAGVEEARNGAEAFEKFKEIGKYDLVLLDLQMPDLTGMELIPHIRKVSQDVVVVMLTAAGDVKTAIEAIREGADGFLTKQDLPLEGDRSEFFYALEQAREYRAGIIARQQLENIKADFYSMVTHDLKNPANVIQLALGHIKEQDSSNLSDDQRKAVQVAHEAAEQLQHLVVDYLDYAKIDAGYFELETAPTDVAGLLRKSVDQAKLSATNKGQILDARGLDRLETVADEVRLKQVMDNLISNAIKYTPEGGLIEVILSSTSSMFRVVVRDTGNGIGLDQLTRLFKKYQRLPGESRRSIGTGLGLVIVKSIVEAHGGRVWAESAGIGEGSAFTLELPLRTP
jgi:signal transduction histidine kinase